jgi:tetratricopeptide (TPR) repeat protein
MLHKIVPYASTFAVLDISLLFCNVLDVDAWKSVLHILNQEQVLRLSSQCENQEQIIADLQALTQVQRQEISSLQWAFAHTMLALAYMKRLTGDKQDNIVQANAHCASALTVLTRENEPQAWALVQLTRGEICRNLLTGERQEHLRQALEHCQNALQVHTRDKLPLQWACTHAILGHVYSAIASVGDGDAQAEMLDQALEHYRQALQVITEESTPVQWAIIQQGLTIIATLRQDGLKVHHLQQAITLGQSSLRVLTRAVYPLEWAKVHACLGEAYRQATVYTDLQELYSGRSVMQEQALRHVEAALQVYTMHDYRHEWARVKNFEGMIYKERVRGKRSENLAQARCCFKAASRAAATNFTAPF